VSVQAVNRKVVGLLSLACLSRSLKKALVRSPSSTTPHSQLCLENYETVLLTLFKYLSLLRASPLEKYHHEEIRALGEIHFRFTEKERAESYVSDIACSMNKPYMREHILSGETRVWDWDGAMVRELLHSLTPDKARVLVLAKEFKDDTGWKNETWYETEYRVRKMDEKLLAEVRDVLDEKSIPTSSSGMCHPGAKRYPGSFPPSPQCIYTRQSRRRKDSGH
jgi:Middle or third domain of peptidase_M16